MKLINNFYIRNYGSVLQSYATYHVLHKIDSSVQVVNYVPRNDIKAKLEIGVRIRLRYLLDFRMVRNKIHKIITRNKDYVQISSDRGKVFDAFVRSKMSFTKKYRDKSDIAENLSDSEVLVIGSDQLWSPEDIICNYHTLNWVSDKVKKVAYATSFGVNTIPNYLRERTKKYLLKMDSISVREASGVKIIYDLLNKKVPQVCDPTLLLKKTDWEKILNDEEPSGDYIFCFFIGDNPDQRKSAKELKEKTGLEIWAIQHLDQYIPSDNGFADRTFNMASPEQFINLIKHSKYVLCDSFHATIFSIIYERKFLVFDRYSNKSFASRNSRIDSLCTKLNLSKRRRNTEIDLYDQINADINYDDVKKRIEEFRNFSISYLRNAIEENYK